MLTISTRVSRFDELRAIVEAHDNVFCSSARIRTTPPRSLT